MRQTTRPSINIYWLFYIYLICISAVIIYANVEPTHAVNVRDIYGASIDATEQSDTIPPCATMGYSVDASLTLPTIPVPYGIEWMRSDRDANSHRVGYVIARHPVTNEKIMVSYNLSTMQVISSTVINAPALGKYTSGNQSGDVINNTLYLFRLVNNSVLFGCSASGGNPCLALTKFDQFGNVLGEAIGGLPVQNIDDARLSDASSFLFVGSNGVSRHYQNWSVPGGAFIGVGPSLGVTGSGIIAVGLMEGNKYVGFTDAAKTVHRLLSGNITVAQSGTFAGAFALNNTLSSLYTLAPQASLLLGESIAFGGVAPSRGYLSTSLVHVGTTNYNLILDESASHFGTFWDATNNRIHGFRNNPGTAIVSQVIRTTPDTGVVEERFPCSVCVTAAATQTKEFVESMGRLFIASNDGVNNFVTRIKVCATGGPSA